MKNFIKLIILVLILSTTSLFSNVETTAATNKISATTTDNLNVREKPETNAKKLGTLKKGTKIEVQENLSSGWSKITYNKKAAYVSTKYLSFGTISSKWNGNYGYSFKNEDYSGNGILNITKQTNNKFYFSIEVGSENHYNGNLFNGFVEGYATFKGNTANVNIKNEAGVCKMKMEKTTKGIKVTEDGPSLEYGGCSDFRGVQVSFDGLFKKK